jgi:hypothetical protein
VEVVSAAAKLTVIHIAAQHHGAGSDRIDLDPVTAFIEDFEPGRGQLTLVCWGRAWSHFWGAMGKDNTVEQFVTGAWTGYIVDKLMLPSDVLLKRSEEREERWLTQIVDALKHEIKTQREQKP